MFAISNRGWVFQPMTVDDPKAYTKPWTVRVDQRLIVDQDLIEFECNENNQQFRQHVK